MNVRLINFLELFQQPVQYSVPRWQRRYSWDKTTIQQLIKDLEVISKLDKENASHFGGTLITYSETTPAGTAQIFHVVDGQQRLTTVSILLACIAEKLKEIGRTGKWSSKDISNVFLKNQLSPPRKLSLQDEDDKEYKQIIEGTPKGQGKVTAAWEVLRSEVASVGADCLMEGLSRFKVISFTCQPFDDPQQIFESLNATGVPLTEGEKVKNWLLMGLDKQTQEDLYQDHWCELEKCLGAIQEPKHIDEFLRDFLRWKTGETYGISQTYANLRRWWYKTEGSKDRTSLCEELAGLAKLYGKITGTNGEHESRGVNKQLEHLRGLRIDVHRPFTLRLLNDAIRSDDTGANKKELTEALKALSTWLTRLWLTGKSTSALNNEFARLAHREDNQKVESYANYWIAEIKKLRHTGIAVPNEEEIREGIRKRKAYGGKASGTAKTILWAMSSQLGKDTSVSLEKLSIDHIMPQNLSKEWEEYLGKDFKEVHGDYLNSLANLTLVGEKFNPALSNQIYSKKKEQYQKHSNVMLTRELSKTYMDWRAEDIEKRVQELTNLVIKYWPWENVSRAIVRWRINNGEWREEKTYKDVLLNVVAKLIDLDPEWNSKSLLAGKYKIGGTSFFRSGSEPKGYYIEVPRHDEYKINAGIHNKTKVMLCHEMADRCDVKVEMQTFTEWHGGQQSWEELDSNDPNVTGII